MPDDGRVHTRESAPRRAALDADSPFAAGREIWGWPKKEALITLEKGERTFTGTVKRGDIVLADVAMKKSKPSTPAEIDLLQNAPYSYFNQKLIPSVVEDAAPEAHQLTLMTFDKFKLKEAHTYEPGEVTIKFGMSRADPLQAIPVLGVLAAFDIVADCILPYGKIAHDYLKRR